MSGFETLGGILNITQILSAILKHAQDHKSIAEVLEKARTRSTRIHENIRLLAPLKTQDGVESQFVKGTVQDFGDIHTELSSIQEKLENRNAARTFLTSTETLSRLKCIESRLSHKEHNIQMMGIVLTMAAEQRFTKERVEEISANVVELKNRSIDMEPAESLLQQVFQQKFVAMSGVLDESQRRDEGWINQIDGIQKLATGISFYEGNQSFNKDYVKAARYLNAALEAGKWEANYYLGMLYRRGKGVKRCNVTAVHHFEKGTHAKDAKAITALGQCYLLGAGVELNSEIGSGYIQIASAYKDPVAMSIRSWQKLYGHGTEVNPSLAFQLAKKAVKKGNKRAKMNLATCYMHGLGVERNAAKAVRLWDQASKAGALAHLIDLAECYEQGNGVDVDYGKAVELYEKGLEFTGNTWRRAFVQAFYGRCLILGRGVAQNIRKGWALVESSTKETNGSGWLVEGECYRYGYGVKRDPRKAIKSYLRATDGMNSIFSRIRAHYALGCMYEAGEGTVRNLNKAFQHFEYSANRIHREAQWKIGLFCESGFGIEQNVARAAEYYRLAANSGHKESQLKSNEYYMKGMGVQKDIAKSTELLRVAAESDDPKAKQLLRRIRRKWRIRGWRSKSSER